MRNLWNELVNSLGFALSVVVVFLLLPMAFTFVMGTLGDAEALGGLIFGLLIVGVPLYLLASRPTQAQKEETLWKEEKKAEPRPKTTFTGKILETSVEQAERLDVRKREHFEKLPAQLYYKYRYGVRYKNTDYIFNVKCDIFSHMRGREEFNYMFRGRYFFPEIINISLSKPHGNSPHLILEGAINEHLKNFSDKDRDYMEKNQKQKLEDMRWAANYVALAAIYAHNNYFTVSLSSDMREYMVKYPFGVPPLKYQFDCTKEEEEQFFKDAFQRVEDCKIIVDNAFKKGLYTAQNKLFAEYNLNKSAAPHFEWAPNIEEKIEERNRKDREEQRKRKEAEKYERETGELSDK